MSGRNHTVEQHYTINQAAELLAVSTRTIKRYVAGGRLRVRRLPGGSIRVPASALQALGVLTGGR